MEKLRKKIYTMAGMWSLWDFKQYNNINSYEEWENLFLNDKDIVKQIELSKFVPIYLHTDGSYLFEVKINEKLTERENKYVVKKSQKYLLKSDGEVILSGIEFISNSVNEDEVIKVNLDNGFYSVEIYLIAWDAEPNMKLEDGCASSDALPDIIIGINKVEENNETYRKSIETFD